MRREKDRRISTLAKPCHQRPELQIYELLHGMRALCFYLPVQRMSSALCKQMFCPPKRKRGGGKGVSMHREGERESVSKNAVCRCQSGLQSRSNLSVLQKEDT